MIVQVPADTNVSVPPDVIVQTPVVEDVKETVKLDVLLALSVGVVPKFCAPGGAKVMVCGALTGASTVILTIAGTDVPLLLVAV